MRPTHKIELLYQRENTDQTTDVSDVCAALELLESWLKTEHKQYAPYFHDQKKGEEVREVADELFKGYGLFAQLKRLFRNEENPSKE